MKALTLRQPWASLVAIGAKKIETRSWGTRYRGPLAIHAAKSFPKVERGICYEEPFASALIDVPGVLWSNSDELPLGCIVATARLVDVLPIFAPDEQIPKDTRSVCVEDDEGGPLVWVWRSSINLGGDTLYVGESGWSPSKPDGWAGEHEAEFGDYRSGRFAWLLADVRPTDPRPGEGRSRTMGLGARRNI